MRGVVVTGGGTGGHVFTGVAVLDALRARFPAARATFIGSVHGSERWLVPRAGHELALIGARALRLNGVRGALAALRDIPGAVLAARDLLERLAPDVVLGVGGPASGPTLVAAKALGIPALLHEQNSVPGLANRLSGGLVDEVMVGLPQVRGRFVSRPVTTTGNPVRAELVAALLARERAAPRGTDDDPLRVLVLGGSDGSGFINQRAPALIARAAALTGRRVAARHQCGVGNPELVRARYRERGVACEVASFFVDIAAVYATSDVTIALAGAGTLAELALAGMPALIVPLATAADDHQRENAFHFARAGAIRLLDQTQWSDDAATAELARLLADAGLRAALSANMRALARPDAADLIVARLAARAPGRSRGSEAATPGTPGTPGGEARAPEPTAAAPSGARAR